MMYSGILLLFCVMELLGRDRESDYLVPDQSAGEPVVVIDSLQFNQPVSAVRFSTDDSTLLVLDPFGVIEVDAGKTAHYLTLNTFPSRSHWHDVPRIFTAADGSLFALNKWRSWYKQEWMTPSPSFFPKHFIASDESSHVVSRFLTFTEFSNDMNMIAATEQYLASYILLNRTTDLSADKIVLIPLVTPADSVPRFSYTGDFPLNSAPFADMPNWISSPYEFYFVNDSSGYVLDRSAGKLYCYSLSSDPSSPGFDPLQLIGLNVDQHLMSGDSSIINLRAAFTESAVSTMTGNTLMAFAMDPETTIYLKRMRHHFTPFVEEDENSGFTAIDFDAKGNGVIVGEKGVLYSSSDGGITWIRHATSPDYHYTCVAVDGTGECVAGTREGKLLWLTWKSR